jgi:predicted acylesterase/phospholipase RssA
MSAEEFEAFAGRLSHAMARRGVFFWPGRKRFILALVPLTLWSPVYQFLMIWVGAFDGWSWDLFWLGQLLYAVPMALYSVVVLVYGRRKAQTHLYASFVANAVSSDRKGKRRIRKMVLADLFDSQVRHVLCATELTSGEPVYMDRHMIHSPTYGTGEPVLRTAEAIYASAAFPIVFPPLRVRPSALRMSGGEVENRPDNLVLSDGGVFNNLGTDSMTAWDDLRRSPFVSSIAAPLPDVPDQFIVVNASSPPQLTSLSNVPGWRSLVATRRTMTVLYENTLRPRIQALLEAGSEGQTSPTIVIDIADSPVELATRMQAGAHADRAAAVLQSLRRARGDAAWHAFATRASSTKTVLTPIGDTAAVRLLMLGYLDAAVACHIQFGTPGVEGVPDEGWFIHLLESNE